MINRGSNSQNQANAHSVSSHSTLFTYVYVWNAFDFNGEIKKWQMFIVDKNVRNGVNLADTDPWKWVSSRISKLLRTLDFMLYYV